MRPNTGKLCAPLLYLVLMLLGLGGAACAAPGNTNAQPTATTVLMQPDGQDEIGWLNAQLEQNEAATFAGLWIEQAPTYRVVVAFTRNGPETIKRYTANTSLAGQIEVRTAKISLAELSAVQRQLMDMCREFGWPFSSATIVQENVVEFIVTDRTLMEADLARTGRKLPDHVKVSVIYEPLANPPPFPITPVAGIAMPQLRVRSAAFMAALTGGNLTLRDGCLYAGDELIIWQPDYFLNDNGGRVEVLDRKGKVVATVGEEVRMGGGEIPLTPELERQLREPIPSQCKGPYWLMGQIETEQH